MWQFIFILISMTFSQKVVIAEDGYISLKGVQFMLNGEAFYANGFNAYWLMYEASFPSERPKISKLFQDAQNSSLKIARTWAFSDGGNRPLQSSPGSYNEEMFQGLDFVVSEAKKYGIKLILSLVNNYEEYGGRKQYMEWAKSKGVPVSSNDDFYTNPVIKEFYKNHIKTVLTRVNVITGVAYKDDPTIMAWELMNEPRCISDLSGQTLQNWIREMTAYLKLIDAKHLLEVGFEGFYGASTPDKINTTNPKSKQFGTDFIAHNQIPGVDFATVHCYPDQWLEGENSDVQFAFLNRWVNQHIEDSQNILVKPVIFGEFGKSNKMPGYTQDDRDRLYKLIYDAIYSSASKGGTAGGGLFWHFLADGLDNFRDGYEIILTESKSVASIIYDEAQKMANL